MASKSSPGSILKSRNSVGTDTEEIQPQVQQCISIVSVSNTTISITAKRDSCSSKPEVKEIPNLCFEKQEEFPDMEMTFCAGGDESFSVFETNNENVAVMDMSMTMIDIDAVFNESDECAPNVPLAAHKNLHEGSLYEGIENEPISSYWMGTENLEMTFGCDASDNFSTFKTYNGNLPYSTLDMSMTVLHMDSMPTEAKSSSPTVANLNETYDVSSSEQNQYEPAYFLETEDMEMTCWGGEEKFSEFKTYNENLPQTMSDMSLTMHNNEDEQSSLIPKDNEASGSHTSPNQDFFKNAQPINFTESKNQLSKIPILSCKSKRYPGNITKANPKMMLDRVVYSVAAGFQRNNVGGLRKQFWSNSVQSYGKFASTDSPKRKIAGLKHEVEVQTTSSLANQCAKTPTSISGNVQLADQSVSIPDQMTEESQMGSKDVANISESVQLADQSEMDIPEILLSHLRSYENAVGFNLVILIFKIQEELCDLLTDDQFEKFYKVESERKSLPDGLLRSCQLSRSFRKQLEKKIYVQLAENRNADI